MAFGVGNRYKVEIFKTGIKNKNYKQFAVSR